MSSMQTFSPSLSLSHIHRCFASQSQINPLLQVKQQQSEKEGTVVISADK